MPDAAEANKELTSITPPRPSAGRHPDRKGSARLSPWSVARFRTHATGSRITIYRIVEGRIAERWSEQGLGILEQLGIPTPTPATTHAGSENSE